MEYAKNGIIGKFDVIIKVNAISSIPLRELTTQGKLIDYA